MGFFEQWKYFGVVNCAIIKLRIVCYKVIASKENIYTAFAREKGGTKNTIDYAKKKGIEIFNVLDEGCGE